MTLKRKINQAEYDVLNGELKQHYVQKDGDWLLNLEDKAFDELKQEKQTLQAKLDQIEAEKREAEKKAAEAAVKREADKMEKQKKDGEWEAYTKSLEEKVAKLQSDNEAIIKRHREQLSNDMLTREVDRIANELSTAPSLLKPVIRERLTVDFVGDDPRIFVMDEKGLKTAMSVKEFEKSIVDNSEFSAIIKQTAGGASTQNQNGFSGTKTINNNQAPQGGSVNILDMTPDQQAAFAKQLESSM